MGAECIWGLMILVIAAAIAIGIMVLMLYDANNRGDYWRNKYIQATEVIKLDDKTKH